MIKKRMGTIFSDIAPQLFSVAPLQSCPLWWPLHGPSSPWDGPNEHSAPSEKRRRSDKIGWDEISWIIMIFQIKWFFWLCDKKHYVLICRIFHCIRFVGGNTRGERGGRARLQCKAIVFFFFRILSLQRFPCPRLLFFALALKFLYTQNEATGRSVCIIFLSDTRMVIKMVTFLPRATQDHVPSKSWESTVHWNQSIQYLRHRQWRPGHWREMMAILRNWISDMIWRLEMSSYMGWVFGIIRHQQSRIGALRVEF